MRVKQHLQIALVDVRASAVAMTSNPLILLHDLIDGRVVLRLLKAVVFGVSRLVPGVERRRQLDRVVTPLGVLLVVGTGALTVERLGVRGCKGVGVAVLSILFSSL